MVDEYAARSATPSAVSAQGRIEVVDGGYALEFNVGTQPSPRRLEHATCEPLGRAAALILAVAVDPVAVAGHVAPSGTPSATDEPPPKPAPVAVPASDVAPPPAAPTPARADTIAPQPPTPPRRPVRTSPRLGLRPEFVIGTALLPGTVEFGFGGAAALFGRHWRVELDGTYWLPQETTIDDTGIGGRVSLAHGGVRGCYVADAGPLQVPLCGGLSVGALIGRSVGLTPRVRNTDVWAGLPLSAGLAWAPVRALALFARAEAVVSLRIPGFHVEGLSRLHRVGSVGARAAIGAEVRFF